MTPDVMILGTCRSGTSTTARVLHEKYGVCFGHVGIGSTFKGEVVYEDSALKEALFKVTRESRPIDWWLEHFRKNHRGCRAERRGVKLLDLALLSADQIRALSPRLIVRTWRPRESCIESWQRYNRRSRSWAERYYDEREAVLERLERELAGFNFVRLNFLDTARLTDREIADAVRFEMEHVRR